MRLNNTRISPRKPLRTKVIFEDEFNDDFIYFYSTDISMSGIFIESSIMLPERTKVFLKFSITDTSPTIQLTGEIVRLMEKRRGPGRQSRNPKIGIGIRFLGPTRDTLLQIEKYLTD